MALTKVKNSNLHDADLVALAGNDGSSLTGVSVAPSSITGLTSTAAELNILDGVTASSAELNILDGVTSTAAELNILDGVTASTTELNYVDGVTALIQTQLDAKQAGDTDLTTLATNGIGTSANQLVQLDGTAKLPAVDGSQLTGVDSLPTQTSQSGKFLTTDGSAASWEAAPSGGLVHISTVTASSSSTVNITGFNTTYDHYVIEISGLIGSNYASLRATIFVAGVEQTAQYFSNILRHSYSTTSSSDIYWTSTSGSYWLLSAPYLGHTVNNFSTSIKLFGTQDGQKKLFSSQGIATFAGTKASNAFGAQHTAPGALTKMKFYADSGTLTGTFRLYGITKG